MPVLCTQYHISAEASLLLKTFYTYPVTSATVERGNSALAHIKTKHRSTMGQERFNALLLLFVHRDITVEPEEILKIFQASNRRLRFY